MDVIALLGFRNVEIMILGKTLITRPSNYWIEDDSLGKIETLDPEKFGSHEIDMVDPCSQDTFWWNFWKFQKKFVSDNMFWNTRIKLVLFM